jgi:hypothetical protein
MENDSSEPSAEEIADRVAEYANLDTLSPREYEQALHAVGELTPLFEYETSYFVLGSYGTPEIHRLQLVKDRLNRRPEVYAFLMVDIRGEWTNTLVKFRILADYATYLVGIAEHNRSGFLVEQGMFTLHQSYFERAHVLKREYDQPTLDAEFDGSEPYSALQLDGFDMLDQEGRLFVWTTEDELMDAVEALP